MTAPDLHDLTLVVADPATAPAGLRAVTSLDEVVTPFLLIDTTGAQLDLGVLDRMLTVLRSRPDVVAAIGGLATLDRTRHWPRLAAQDAVVPATRVVEVSVHTRSLAAGPPCTTILRTHAAVGPVDALVVHRSLADALEPTAYVHGETLARVAPEQLAGVGDEVDWTALVAQHGGPVPDVHLVGSTPLTARPWWGDAERAAVMAAVRDDRWPDSAAVEQTVALVLARTAVATSRGDRAGAMLDVLLARAEPPVEAIVLAAELLDGAGEHAEAERLLVLARSRAPFDQEVHERLVAVMSSVDRPAVGKGPRLVLQGPDVLSTAAVAGRTTVVVVTYASQDTIRACVEPLVGHDDIEVVVVDNSPDDAVVEALLDLPVVLRRPGRNLGFAAGCNHGIEVATGDAVLLLNPDAVITPTSLRRLRRLMAAQGLDAIGPLSDHVSGPQKAGAHLDVAAIEATRHDDPVEHAAAVDALAHAEYGDRVLGSQLLIGFCLMVSRRALERVGGLDPALFFGCDDLDLSWRLTETGGRLGVALGVFAHHVGHVSAASTGSERRASMTRDANAVLARKLHAYYGERPPSGMALWGVPWSPMAI